MTSASVELSTLPTASLLSEEPVVPTGPAMPREKVPAAERPKPEERPMLVDQSHSEESQVEVPIALEEPVAPMTQEVVSEPIVLTEAELSGPEEPSSPRIAV